MGNRSQIKPPFPAANHVPKWESLPPRRRTCPFRKKLYGSVPRLRRTPVTRIRIFLWKTRNNTYFAGAEDRTFLPRQQKRCRKCFSRGGKWSSRPQIEL